MCLEQTGAFQFGVEASSVTKEENLVAQFVVAFGPVTATRADQTMVSIAVYDVVAERAMEL